MRPITGRLPTTAQQPTTIQQPTTTQQLFRMSPSSSCPDYPAALEFLLGRIDYERTAVIPYRSRQFKLDRMLRFLAAVENPHHHLRAVHLAGTKGKGSTASMIAAVCRAAGYRTGLYTSPHLVSIEERMVVDGQACSPSELVDLVDQVRHAVAEMDREASAGLDDPQGLTYFEITTAMAMLHFASRRVDIAVLEVGLGGRLDSTNVCRPEVTAITSISFDHMRQLGSTLAAIASEKAGIVKPGVPMISGVVESEPRDVIRAVCRDRAAPLIEVSRDYRIQYQPGPVDEILGGWVDFTETDRPDGLRLNGARLGLVGPHQGANAGVALAVLAQLSRRGWEFPEAALRTGLEEVRCAARVELIQGAPTVVIDAAHNAASIESLCAAIDERFSDRRGLLVFATSRDKDIDGMLSRLIPRFDRIVFTRYQNNPRGIDPAALVARAQALIESNRDADLAPPEIRTGVDPPAAWKLAAGWAAAEDVICVTGSFFVAAEVRELVVGESALRQAAMEA